ncbi:MAG TPA: thioesterase II family protein [Blastocatellia bacterium]|nr:thioesterase II family protein [Blastocatellia bacterium]
MSIFNMMPPKTPSRWFSLRRENPGARLRLFCLPYAGGGTNIFHNWPDGLPSSIEVRPVQLPGRGARLNEPPYTEMAPLVDAIMGSMLPYLDKPFALFGHSMGALIGFELARQLRRVYGQRPSHLFVSASVAPHLAGSGRKVHAMLDPEFVEELRYLNGTPRELLANEEFMRLMLPVLRADFKVCETYTYVDDLRLDCPLTAYGGLQDESVRCQDLEAWRHHTTGSFAMHLFRGDHFFLHTARPLLLEVISRDLEEDERLAA